MSSPDYNYLDWREVFEELAEPETVIANQFGWSGFRCKACAGSAFKVWSADYMTAIACTNCGVPAAVHEG